MAHVAEKSAVGLRNGYTVGSLMSLGLSLFISVSSLWAPGWQDSHQPGQTLASPALSLVEEMASILMVWAEILDLILTGPRAHLLMDS